MKRIAMSLVFALRYFSATLFSILMRMLGRTRFNRPIPTSTEYCVRMLGRRLLFCSVFCACVLHAQYSIAASPAEADTTAGRKSCLRLLNSPIVTVDQTNGTGDATLYFRNETSKPVSLALIGAVKTPLNSPVRIEFSADSKSIPTAIYEGTVPPKVMIPVRLLVENVWDDGEFDIEIANHYGTEPSGKIHARRFPVSIKLDGIDRLKLGLVDGDPGRVSLRNDDAVPYPVSWKLINGEDVCGGDTVLKSKASTLLECTPHLGPRFTRLLNLLKQDTSRDGYRLVLLPRSDPSKAGEAAVHPIKTFSAEASLDFFAPFTRAASSYAFLILLLTAGGLSSLMLSYLLPNKLLRLDLKDKLIQLAARTADLSTRIESRLAVLVRLERSRLMDLLWSRNVLSPDFATIAAQCSIGIERLSSKVAVLEQMDVVLGRLQRKLGHVPPTQVDEINASLKDAGVLLGKGEVSETDIQAAGTKVKDSSLLVDALGEPNDTFGRTLADMVSQLLRDLDTNAAASATYLAMLARLPGPNSVLRRLNPADQLVSPGKYVEVDFALQKMYIIRAYVQMQDGVADADVKARLSARQETLIKHLQTASWDALNSARLLLREMEDDVYPERLLEILRNPGGASIEMDPSYAYERSPLDFYVFFHKSAFNTSAAREEISVHWDFGDGLKEKGWTVSHYFQLKSKLDMYKVQAQFNDQNGEVLTDSDGTPITLVREVKINRSALGHKVGERTRTELLKLGATLLIAVFGLVSGAQEQIAKLDILPGMVAIFLLGFSADSIKRLLTTTKT